MKKLTKSLRFPQYRIVQSATQRLLHQIINQYSNLFLGQSCSSKKDVAYGFNLKMKNRYRSQSKRVETSAIVHFHISEKGTQPRINTTSFLIIKKNNKFASTCRPISGMKTNPQSSLRTKHSAKLKMFNECEWSSHGFRFQRKMILTYSLFESHNYLLYSFKSLQ